MKNPNRETKKDFAQMQAIFYGKSLAPSRGNRASNVSAYWTDLVIPDDTPAGTEFVVRHTLNRIPSSFFIAEGGDGLVRSGVWTRTTITVKTTKEFSDRTVLKIMIV